ncbi:hypothetical protein [Effusibacillus dendaii]|uniref:Uncharacterized protein n=1 Tax=Effusibacillus dendaii TaxID=2743772 RepID=A0A7I8D9I9_9BACL|nr:hypothetical protein [Effusibacillus dendaii]BCJ86745.1 hypothetical protein skT53_17300 [Effusibacillus dendaii]
MFNQTIAQDIQQIRDICQQLAQNERQNAQIFSNQPGMQTIAQRENQAAQQLQYCVSLCNRIEQSFVQGVGGSANFTATGAYTIGRGTAGGQSGGYSQGNTRQYGAGYNPSVFTQMMGTVR